MRRLWKTLAWVTGSVLVLMALLLGLVYVFQDDIKAYVLDSLNRHLTARIEVAEVEVNVWHSFPFASLNLQDVKAYEGGALAREDSLLLEAADVFLQFNIWDVVYQKYTIRRLELRQGRLNVRTAGAEQNNFSIWREDSLKTEDGEPVHFELRALILYAMDLHWEDVDKAFKLALHADEAFAKGRLEKKQWELDLEWQGVLQALGNTKYPWFKDRALVLDAALSLDLEQNRYALEQGFLETPGLGVMLTGQWEGMNTPRFGLNFTTEKTNISEALALLPPDWQLMPEDYNGKGFATASGSIEGTMNQAETFLFDLKFAVEEGALIHKQSGLELEGLSFKGTLQKQGKGALRLDIPQLTALMEDRPIKASLAWEEGKPQHLDLRLQGTIDLHHWEQFLPFDSVLAMNGLAHLDLEYHGPIQSRASMLLEGSSTGKVELEQVSLDWKKSGYGLSEMTGRLELDKTGFHTKDLRGKSQSTSFRLTAKLHNLPAFVLGQTALLMLNGSVHMDRLLLDEWLKTQEGGKATEAAFMLPGFLQGSADFSIDAFSYRKFKARKVQGKAWIRPGRIDVQEVELLACEGSMGMDGQIRALDQGGFALVSELRLNDVNVQQLFYATENFGQHSLSHQHVEGKLTSKARYSGTLAQDLSPDMPATVAWSHVEIKKGRLREFEPIKALSAFIKLEELNDVRFETISNDIEIADSEVIIPTMNIRSSALDLELSGRHGFDNRVDYRFNLLLKDLLASKYRILKQNKQEEFGELEESQGGARLFLKMTGTMDNPKISYDMASTVQKIKQDLKEEKKTLRTLLREDFGLFKRDTTLDAEDPLPERPNPNRVRSNDDFEFE